MPSNRNHCATTLPRTRGYTLPRLRKGLPTALVGAALCILLSACDAESMSPTPSGTATGTTEVTKTLPPGFLDPAPAGPESDTVILSGGTLLGEAVEREHPDGLFDAVVVLRNGVLLAFGRRGSVDVPADSIGIDTSGRFIVPTGAFVPGEPATVRVLDARPVEGTADRVPADVYTGGRWIPGKPPAQ